jgi:hypothetical protein
VVVDCADLERARFWAGALGYVSPGPGSDRYRSVLPAGGSGIQVLLQRTGWPGRGYAGGYFAFIKTFRRGWQGTRAAGSLTGCT